MYADKNFIKQNLTVQEITELMTGLGSAPPMPDRNGNSKFQTICHNMPSKNNSYKLYYYDNTKLFRCYTGCGESFMDIFEIIEKAIFVQKGYEWELNDCINYVIEKTGKAFDFSENNSFLTDMESSTAEDWNFINKQLKMIKNKDEKIEEELKYYPKTYLKAYRERYYSGWINEGITVEAMKKFQIGIHLPTERITIPYFDMSGNLIGVRGRTLKESDLKNKIKYMPMKHGAEYLTFPMSSVMYGLFENQETIRKLKKAVIFEAEKSVLQLESFYSGNNIGLALGGSNLFLAHVQILLDLGVEDVYLALDKEYHKYEDNEYLSEYTLKVKEMKDKLINYFNVYIVEDREGLLEYKDSPTDRGGLIFSKLVKESTERE